MSANNFFNGHTNDLYGRNAKRVPFLKDSKNIMIFESYLNIRFRSRFLKEDSAHKCNILPKFGLTWE